MQVTRTDIKARTSSNLGGIGLFTLELFALERGNFFPLIYNGENDVSTFSQLLWIQSPSNLQLTRTGVKCWTGSNSGRIWWVTWSYIALSGKKHDVSNFSQSPLLRYLSNLQVTRTGIKARNEFEFGPDRIIHFGVIRPWALNFSPYTYIGEMMYPSFLSYSEFNLHQIYR